MKTKHAVHGNGNENISNGRSNGNGLREVQKMRSVNFGPTFDIIQRDAVPSRPMRGREAFIKQMPFWPLLIEKLQKGLAPFEAVDIELKSCQDADGDEIDAKQMVARIRYQFQQLGLSKKYTMIVNENNHLYVVDHETKGQVSA